MNHAYVRPERILIFPWFMPSETRDQPFQIYPNWRPRQTRELYSWKQFLIAKDFVSYLASLELGSKNSVRVIIDYQAFNGSAIITLTARLRDVLWSTAQRGNGIPLLKLVSEEASPRPFDMYGQHILAIAPIRETADAIPPTHFSVLKRDCPKFPMKEQSLMMSTLKSHGLPWL